jgi:hypothetical protein
MLFIRNSKERTTAQRNREDLVVNEDKYIAMLKSGVPDIMTHIMKFFFYCNYTTRQGLRAPQVTFDHWASEIATYFDFGLYPNFHQDRISSYRRKELVQNMIKETNIYKTQVIDSFMRDMRESNEFHRMPKISRTDVENKWELFLVFYNVVMIHLINRLLKRNTQIDEEVFVKYLLAGARSKGKTDEKIQKAAARYANFSYLEDELRDLCEKYGIIKMK